MNLDFSTLYALWATDFFQKNALRSSLLDSVATVF